jgi:CDP-glucose 4,6-dehydratase
MKEAYNGQKVLITGHNGFKGSWLTTYLNMLGADVLGISLPTDQRNLHYRVLKLNNKEHLIDIENYDELKSIVKKFNPKIIFHLAAQPLVRESYLNPRQNYSTNVLGSLNIYEAARECKSIKVLISVTTDKVYHNTEQKYHYKESDILGGHDPYSASKACVEIMTDSYRKSFLNDDSQLKIATVRAGNVIGGGDWNDDRLIPDAIKAAIEDRTMPVRNPQSIRPWQHVLDPIYAYLLLGQRLLNNESFDSLSWNFGPDESYTWTVEEVLNECQKQWNKISWESKKSDAEPHEAGTLLLDISKAKKELNWKPVWDTKTAIRKSIEWYQCFFEKNEIITQKQILEYQQDLQNLETN